MPELKVTIGIVTRRKKTGQGSGGADADADADADAAVKTKPKCDTCNKNHNGVYNKFKSTEFFDRLNTSRKPNWNKKEKLYVARHIAQVSEAIENASDSKVDFCSKKQ